MRTLNRCRYLWITSVIILPYVFGHSQCKRTRYIHHTANPSAFRLLSVPFYYVHILDKVLDKYT